MASSSKERSAFTDNSIGGKPGKSNGEKRTSVPGGTLLSAYPQDNVHGVELPGCYNGVNEFGGGDNNLAHSLKGASAVQHHSDRDGQKFNKGERKL